MRKIVSTLVILHVSLYAENNIVIGEPYYVDGGYQYQDYTIKAKGEECLFSVDLEDDMILSETCKELVNSKGIKILCTKNKKICKTFNELNDLITGKISNKPNRQLENGNNIIINYDDSSLTTFAKNNMKEKFLNKFYTFSGEIYDVLSRKEIVLKINSGNYVNVKFHKNLPDNFLVKKKSMILNGNLSKFGTGIVFNHTITDAKLLNN